MAIKEINIFACDSIIAIGKAFEKEGWELGSLFLKETDTDRVKVTKGVLDIHGHDIPGGNNKGETIAYVSIENSEKFHRAWFKFVGFEVSDFSDWKLFKEDIEYSNI